MQVIEQGRRQNGWAKEYECSGAGNDGGGCGAKLLVEQADLFTTHSSAMGESSYYTTFMCPMCGVLTDVKERDLPGNVLGEARLRQPSMQTIRSWQNRAKGSRGAPKRDYLGDGK